MALFSVKGIDIRGIAAAVPADSVDNLSLESLAFPAREELVRKTGIRYRRIAPPGICASDLCLAAARHILSATDIKSEDLGALVFVTQTPDYPLPGNSMTVQERLGLSRSALMLDLNQGCAGYIYGLATLASLMQSAGIDAGLLLVGDTITRLLSPCDKSTVPIFSDAGSATVLIRSSGEKTMHFNLGADGKGAEVIRVEVGGARHPFRAESLVLEEPLPGIRRAPVHLAMKGLDVLHYSFRSVRPNIMELLESAGWDLDAPDYFIFHQANQILNQGLLRKLGIPAGKAPETLSEFGNTSCATIPVTLSHRLGKKLDEGPLRLLLCGFGVGFSWGSILLEAGPLACPEVLEIRAPHG